MLHLEDNKTYVTACVEYFGRKTDKAVCIQLDSDLTFWCAKSQLIAWNDGVNKFIAIPYWVAKDNDIFAKAFNGQNVHSYNVWNGKELKEYLNRHGMSL